MSENNMVRESVLTAHPEEQRFAEVCRSLEAVSGTIDGFLERLVSVLGSISDHEAVKPIIQDLQQMAAESQKSIGSVDELIEQLWVRWWKIMQDHEWGDDLIGDVLGALEEENGRLRTEVERWRMKDQFGFMFSNFWREFRDDVHAQTDAAGALRILLTGLQRMIPGSRAYLVFDSESTLGNSIVQNIEDMFDLTKQRYEDYMENRASIVEAEKIMDIWRIEPMDSPEIAEYKLMSQLVELVRYQSDTPVRIKRSGDRGDDKFNYGDNIRRVSADDLDVMRTPIEMLEKLLGRPSVSRERGLSDKSPLRIKTNIGTFVLFVPLKNHEWEGLLRMDIPADESGVESTVLVNTYDLVEKIEGIAGYCGESYRKQENQLDHLTGLLLRRVFHERSGDKFSRWIQEWKTVSMAMFDGDKFKRVNDTCGHPMGDLVIKEIAASIKTRARSDDLSVRFWWEEFGILMSGDAGSVATTVLKEIKDDFERKYFGYVIGSDGKLKEAISDDPSTLLSGPKWASEQPVFQVTLSIGVYDTSDGSGKNVEELSKLADERLYQVKEQDGRNRIRFGDRPEDVVVGKRVVRY